MKQTSQMMALMIAVWLIGSGGVLAAVQNWDSSTTAGYQHGDGTWSINAADTNWTAAGTAPRLAWSQTNEATFGSTLAGSSWVTVSGSVTAGPVTLSGNNYTVVLTNASPVTLAIGGGLSLQRKIL